MTGMAAHNRINEIDNEIETIMGIIQRVKMNAANNKEEIVLERVVERLEKEKNELYDKLGQIVIE